MISVNRRTLYGEVYNDVRCLSSDEKPTEGIKNGSTLIEIDTGKRYLYDALSGSWNEFSQGGGGGGSYVLPTMSQSVKGGATLGDGLSISGDSLSVDYSKVASKQSLDDATKVDPDGGLKRTTEGLSADYAKVASVESLESATKLEADGGIKRTSNGLSVDFTEVASVDALEDATALSPTGGIVSTQDGLAISPTQQTTGTIDGALLELTAKSKPATQQTTTGKNLLDDSKSVSNADFKVFGGTLNSNDPNGTLILDAGTYTISSTTVVNIITVRLSASEAILYVTNTTIGSFKLYERAAVKVAIGKNSTDSWSDFKLQLELGSTATPYEPYTGGAPSPSPDYPQPIVTVTGHEVTGKTGRYVSLEAQGKNLLPSISSRTVASAGTTEPSTPRVLDGTVLLSGIGKNGHGRPSYVTSCIVSGESITFTNTNSIYGVGIDAPVSQNTAYTASVSDESTCTMNVVGYDSDGVRMRVIASGNPASFTTPEGCAHVMLVFSSDAAGTYKVVNPQLELGSTATPYKPYYHATTPIPLPSRGWVAGLPDGTADGLRLDGAGKVVWTLPTSIDAFDGSQDETWILEDNGKRVNVRPSQAIRKLSSSDSVESMLCTHFVSVSGRDAYNGSLGFSHTNSGSLFGFSDGTGSMTVEAFTAWLSTHPITVLYPLATPVTETCGYIEGWTNDFSEGCVLSIPELDDLGIKYHIDGAISTLVHQWYEKSRSEYEDRLASLEDAVAQLIAEG